MYECALWHSWAIAMSRTKEALPSTLLLLVVLQLQSDETSEFEAAELLPASRLAVHVRVRVRFQTRNHGHASCTEHLCSVHPEILGIGIDQD